ncbi:MAG: hypothetical protein ABEI06_00945 [Halobacteriaceae archaeon]
MAPKFGLLMFLRGRPVEALFILGIPLISVISQFGIAFHFGTSYFPSLVFAGLMIPGMVVLTRLRLATLKLSHVKQEHELK